MRRVVHHTLIGAVGLLALTACQEEFDSKTILDGYRVLGIQMDPPELRPDTGEVTVRVLDINNSGATYSWSLCAVSAGAISQFECFTAEELGLPSAEVLGLPGDELEFPLPGDTAEITFDFQMVAPAILAAFTGYVVDTCGPEDPQETILYRTGVEIFGAGAFLKLTSGPEGEQSQTAHQLIISDVEHAANANPEITRFTLDGEEGDIEAEVGAEVKLAVELADGARETYVNFEAVQVQNECKPDCAVKSEDGCANADDTTERITYTWFTTGGETDPPVSVWNDVTGNGNESVITLPGEPGTVEVLISVRDDRGGLDIESRTITVKAKAEE